jgi:hypothetical protein
MAERNGQQSVAQRRGKPRDLALALDDHEIMAMRSAVTQTLVVLVVCVIVGPVAAEDRVGLDDMLRSFRSFDQKMGNWYLDPRQYPSNDNKEMALLTNSECDVLAAYLRAYRATQDTHWLDRFMGHAKIVLSMRDDLHTPPFKDYRGKSTPTWTTRNKGYVSPRKNYAFVVGSGNITFPLADFAQMVLSDKVLKKKYGKTAEFLATRVGETLAYHDEQWKTAKVGDHEVGYYVAREDADFLVGHPPGKPGPVNYHTSIGRTHIMMWLATRKEAYRRKATLIAEFVQQELVASQSGAIYWHYWPRMSYMPAGTVVKSGNASVDDVSHGAITVEFIALARRHLRLFSDNTMAGLVRTYSENIHINSTSCNFLLNGSLPGRRGIYTLGGFIYLADYDPQIADMIRSTLVENLEAHVKPEGAAGFKSTAYLMEYLSRSNELDAGDGK